MEFKISLDHLELFFSWKNIITHQDFTFEINETNTSAWYLNYVDKNGEIFKFKYSLATPSWYFKGFKFETIIDDEIIDLFNVSYWDISWNIKSKNKITFYSSFFVVFWKEWVFDFIQSFFDTTFIDWLRRFDIAVDIPENKQNLINSFKKIPSSEIWWNKEEQERETIYFWNRKNKLILVRIYDKIKDTVKKWKTHLFDFWDSKNMTRVEIEFWLNFIKWVNRLKEVLVYKDLLLDDLILRDLFFSRIQSYVWYFFEEKFTKQYKMAKYTPKVENLDKYFIKYGQLPRYDRKVIERCWKYIKMLWLKWFLNISFSKIENSEVIQIYEDFIKYFRFRLKNKIVKKYKVSNKSFKEKVELTEEIFSYLFAWKQDLSDELLFELSITFEKFLNRNHLN